MQTFQRNWSVQNIGNGTAQRTVIDHYANFKVENVVSWEQFNNQVSFHSVESGTALILLQTF